LAVVGIDAAGAVVAFALTLAVTVGDAACRTVVGAVAVGEAGARGALVGAVAGAVVAVATLVAVGIGAIGAVVGVLAPPPQAASSALAASAMSASTMGSVRGFVKNLRIFVLHTWAEAGYRRHVCGTRIAC